jgi:hypothetical protein
MWWAFFAMIALPYSFQRWIQRLARTRGAAARAKFLQGLPPGIRGEIERAERIARERPWVPIAFGLDSVEMAHNGLRLRATGVHGGHSFGFSIAMTMVNGPVALCEWVPQGAASEALLDVLAEFADVPRADSRFDDLVETSAIILQAVPSNVPFARLTQLQSKIFFELADGQPELYLNFDFAAKTGTITEKDPMHRKSLVHAFKGSRSATI